MSTSVLAFPQHRARRPKPDAVRLGYDFSRWCAELYRGERLAQRISFEELDDARAEVERIQANGLRRLPDAVPDWTAVAYGELSDGSLYDEAEDGGGAA